MVSTNRLSTGVQYATKTMFDRQVYFRGANFNNPRLSAGLLATSYLSNTGASGGSLSRIARSTNLAYTRNYIMLAYNR
jgi:hypothetical protein